jgi:LacI family transcriptional regulator, repressor for deo operon, udp, cdd, tsx, nupC, and nupG
MGKEPFRLMTGPRRNQVTSREVASAAGVSQSTVSLVLSGRWSGRVSAATADRVRRAARELRYQPNLAARVLRTERTGTVLVVVPVLANPFFAQVHAGATRVAAKHGIGVVVCPAQDEERREPLPVPQQALDGVLTCGLDDSPLWETWGDTPHIALDSDPNRGWHTVNMDVATGIRQAVDHLLALGHEHIAYLRAERKAWTFDVRHRVVRNRLRRRARLTEVSTSFALAETAESTERVLRIEPRPTAVICQDDNLALAMYHAADRVGLRIPRDLSIVGCDDLPLARLLSPELTTIRLPAEAMGAQGMNALMVLLAGERPHFPPLETTLTIRQSTCAPQL